MNTTTTKLLYDIEVEFELLLQAKTSWGRNDIMSLYTRAKNNVLMRMIDNE